MVSNVSDMEFEATMGQPDLETLGQFFSNNISSPQAEDNALSFSQAHQHYSEMKRLQTSQGPRITKYKQNQSGKLEQQRPKERSQHERPNVPSSTGERPPQTAPSSQMQRIQNNIKNGTLEIKKIAKIKGKLSSGPDLVASTITNGRKQRRPAPDESEEGPQIKQISRTIDTGKRVNGPNQSVTSPHESRGNERFGQTQPIPL